MVKVTEGERLGSAARAATTTGTETADQWQHRRLTRSTAAIKSQRQLRLLFTFFFPHSR